MSCKSTFPDSLKQCFLHVHVRWKSLPKVTSGSSDAGLSRGWPLSIDYHHKAAFGLQVMQRLRELGVLIGKGGLHGNVFRIKPPMCITTDDAEFLTEAFDLALSEL